MTTHEIRPVQAYGAPSSGGRQTHYVYDGDGQRVMKIDPSGPTRTYVYDIFGKSVGEYSSQPSAGTALRHLLSEHRSFGQHSPGH
jgi:YD repeat-containing protein